MTLAQKFDQYAKLCDQRQAAAITYSKQVRENQAKREAGAKWTALTNQAEALETELRADIAALPPL